MSQSTSYGRMREVELVVVEEVQAAAAGTCGLAVDEIRGDDIASTSNRRYLLDVCAQTPRVVVHHRT